MELLLGEMTMAKKKGTGNPGGVRSPGSDDYNGRALPGKEYASVPMLLPDRQGLKTRLRDPAARYARVFQNLPPEEGAGNAGRPMRPIAACAMIVVERTRALVRSHRETPGIPHAMVLRLMSYSPRRSGFFVTVTLEKLASHELDAGVEASGPHDFAVRKKALSSLALPASTASRPNVRDDGQRPSLRGRDSRTYRVICAFGKSEYFFEGGWTGHC
jgi:hypothetical protein